MSWDTFCDSIYAARQRADRASVRPLRSATAPPLDPRDPDPSREGIFRDHNCTRCRDGKLPCVGPNPRMCGNLFARND